MKKIIIICGPTASGKTELAVKLAQFLKTEIISADARQVYKYLDIGTAKPDKSILNQINHYLIDIILPSEKYSANNFVFDCEKILSEFFSSKIPIICGGTGFYIRSLTDWNLNLPTDEKIRNELEKEYEKHGFEKLFNLLLALDADEAKKINKNDKYRLIRNLEIIRITNQKVSELKNQNFFKKKFDYLKIFIFLKRNILYNNINNRVEVMIKKGLIDETKNLLAAGWSENSPGLNTIGYKEIINYLNNKITLNEAKEKIKLNTRHYAKRQFTWFKKEKNIIFCKNDFNYIKELVFRFLNK
ncbi:MAG TPA: tRNA (adenosine(37)-N6)-dimethylallyltransferase MiaA [bacterium]|nr:tRNA (adenosine(37)-N6)-dimethylallyltransferase MiaA [bacterium]HOL46669.1 tRNA (adenosine(37)-N6)-dimethylallyltransferase MiaA [bacterium]HPQ18357.1 tRNA (adenosine(37)-N6)-dimethylallyltransferase MiaA [bacterium]